MSARAADNQPPRGADKQPGESLADIKPLAIGALSLAVGMLIVCTVLVRQMRDVTLEVHALVAEKHTIEKRLTSVLQQLDSPRAHGFVDQAQVDALNTSYAQLVARVQSEVLPTPSIAPIDRVSLCHSCGEQFRSCIRPFSDYCTENIPSQECSAKCEGKPDKDRRALCSDMCSRDAVTCSGSAPRLFYTQCVLAEEDCKVAHCLEPAKGEERRKASVPGRAPVPAAGGEEAPPEPEVQDPLFE
jgi:hypothetical protein